MVVNILCVSVRGVRSFAGHNFRPAWPYYWKAKGWKKRGPYYMGLWEWPNRNREYPELPMYAYKNVDPQLEKYMGVQTTGYTDATTGEFVEVPEMRPELVVPNLKDFKLKPYVSYRTDGEIHRRLREIADKGDYLPGDKDYWPPPEPTPDYLFEEHYAEKVRDAFEKGKYEKNSDFSIFDQNENDEEIIEK